MLAMVPYLVQGAIALAIVLAVFWLLYASRKTVAVIALKIDGRGWLAIGNWTLVLIVLAMAAYVPDLRKDDLFKMIAQGLVMSGFINLVLAFYFTASKPEPPKPPGP